MSNADNYGLDTEEGMANAMRWTQAMVDRLADGGVWFVPRSGTFVSIKSKADKVVKITEGFMPDPSIALVFERMGWSIENS